MGVCLLMGWLTSLSAAADEIDFNRQIRPILSAHCFQCHGPDDEKREAKLRLDDRAAALQAGAIVPGQPTKSKLIERIEANDADEVMPPPHANKPLKDDQRALLRRWVQQGAPYADHWAFSPIRRPPLPTVQHVGWAVNPIDRFILAKLEASRMQPTALADKSTLLRRVCLDLVGLAPTPSWIDALGADDRPDAYERVVDQLMATPAYGERWGRRWLDLARYADTNGYEKDRPRNIWPYRDWVIQALNADLPFDQFTIEQLAGDLLPNASLEQRIATGFHRNSMLNEEGGIDPLEFRFHAMTDRVATTGSTWLGLTLGCCQCHTHKYDPITQKEYYQLFAFLNNADELDLILPDARLQREYSNHRRQAEQEIKQLASQWPADDQDREIQLAIKFAAWLEEQKRKTIPWTTLMPTAFRSKLLLTAEDDGVVFVSGDITKQDTYELEYADGLPTTIRAFQLETLPDDRLPARGPGLTYYEGIKGDFFLGEFEVFVDGQKAEIADASESYAKNQFNKPVSAKLAADGDPQTGWSVADRQGERHTAVFVLQAPIVNGQRLQIRMAFGRHFAATLGKFRLKATAAERPVATMMSAELQTILLRPTEEWSAEHRRQLFAEFLLTTPELAKPVAKIKSLRNEPKWPMTMVMQERPASYPRPTHRYYRGEYLQPKETVEPGVPARLHPFAADLPRNRLGLAQWLMDPSNPLTARVMVNRQWAAFFGQGIVKTEADFGHQGDSPSHPELLDWLATEFIEQRWSLKQLHRLIVTSATYRQASTPTPAARDRDPDNRLLTRAPRKRLEAETLRDVLLQASGMLCRKMGGPGVYPPQPEGVTEAAYGKPTWKESTGEDRYRRSIYTFQKRTAPFAMLQLFDAPSGEACVARRDVSNTPMQALTLLNDPMIVELAQALGRTLALRKGDVATKVRHVHQLLLSRAPTPEESHLLIRFVQTQQDRLKDQPETAKSLAGVSGAPPLDAASWTALARVLMALDETQMRQ